MGVRRVLLLFFFTMGFSLVVLFIVFNLIFNNLDLSFETKVPDSAPIYGTPEEEDMIFSDEPNTSNTKAKENKPNKTTDLKSNVVVPGKNKPEPKPEKTNEASEHVDQPDDKPVVNIPETPAPKEPVPDVPVEVKVKEDEDTNSPPLPPIPSIHTTKPKTSLSQPLYQVYVDGFSSLDDAKAKAQALNAKGVDAYATNASGKPVVKLGTFANLDGAKRVAGSEGAKIRQVN